MNKPEEAQRRQFLLMVYFSNSSKQTKQTYFYQAIQFYEEKIRHEKSSIQIAQYYINIGHWHLLLEDFDKGNHIQKIDTSGLNAFEFRLTMIKTLGSDSDLD
jgi:hypothetical protein